MSDNQRKQKNKGILRPCLYTKKAVGHKGDGNTNCSWCTWNSLQMIGKKTGRIGSQTKNRVH